ncbi:MAG: Phage/plasmid primase, P4 family [archaeon GW2011_AR20]|nr:MAG: Phage/plasmid primase, P4 family [archaeon GW2011_AR20]
MGLYERELKQSKTEKRENLSLDEIKNLFLERGTKQEGIFELTQYFLRDYKIITISDIDEIFIYNNGVYEGNGEKVISRNIQEILEELSSIHVVNEILGHIKRTTYRKREQLEEPKNKLCLENGVLNLDKLKIEEHTSEIIFFNKLSVKYDEKADCIKIKKFLNEIVPESDVSILQEAVGYCLLKDYFIHKAFMLEGGGANGKSTFINLLKCFLGKKNCAAVPLQQLEINRFALSSLFGKLANLFADLPDRALRDTSFFKMLVGEDLIPGERKFKDQFFFNNYAKQIFSCNRIPRSPDDSDAFFRRWVIIRFPNQFLNNQADKRLLTKLTSQEELSGFLNFAIGGLKRLLDQGDFSNSKSINEIREQYTRMSDSVGTFIMDCILTSPEDYEQKKTLYTSYCDYCRSMNYPIFPENTFHRELQKSLRVEDYYPSLIIEGKQQRVKCWRGIKFNLKWEKNPNNLNNPNQIKENEENDVNLVNDVKDVSHLNIAGRVKND